MRDPHQIIIRPLLTEKSTAQAVQNKYHFKVDVNANKIEIAEAVKAIYASDGAKVIAVNTISVKGKKKRAMAKGGKSGYSSRLEEGHRHDRQAAERLYRYGSGLNANPKI